jgi:5-methylcytosine-specific restriction endonuclease McrA
VDHLLPKSRGGPNAWVNLAWMRRDLNQKKGNRTLKEMGWKLIRPPQQPPELPVTLFIRRQPDKPEWDHFLV